MNIQYNNYIYYIATAYTVFVSNVIRVDIETAVNVENSAHLQTHHIEIQNWECCECIQIDKIKFIRTIT